ncbi:MAG: TonB family protein [Archangiaceae bacterium]|nr:TonB family protein [Archangiaceae bacterium]
MKPPPVPREVEEPPREVPPEPKLPPSDLPRADSPLRLPGITEGGNGLSLPSVMLSVDAGYVVQEERRGLHAPEIPKDLVGVTAKEALGRGRVARGMVHPYYVQLGKALIKQWDADRAVSATGLKGFVDSALENNRLWNNIWQEKARLYAKSGNPIADEDMPKGPSRPINDRMMPYGGNPIDQQARRDLQQQMNAQFRATRRATIRVVQDLEGRLTKVELVEPSNDEHVDREALADVRAAAAKLPPPPAEAMEGKHELSSLWSFELVVSITPPVPTFTFEFDEVIGFIDARMPLDRRIYKKVKLVSVE